MTTVAWDGRTLAADRQANYEHQMFECEKVFRLNDGRLFAACGSCEDTLCVLHWLDGLAERPEGLDDFCGIVVDDGRALRIESRLVLIPIRERFHAVGSGAPYALAAMVCGKSARDAVMVAQAFDPQTGMGVSSMEWEER